jgi:hypothetical protein
MKLRLMYGFSGAKKNPVKKSVATFEVWKKIPVS